MKKSILLLFMLSISLFTISCSNDDNNNSNVSTEEQALLGTWKVVAYGTVNSSGVETINQITNTCLNTYKFTSDKNVNYKSYASCTDVEEENGTWSLSGGLLTRTFPQGVTVIMKHNITFINQDKIKLFEVGNTTNFSIYQREGSTLQDTSFKVEVGGILKTNLCDITTNSYSVKLEYLSDTSTINTQNFNGNTQQTISNNYTLTGNVIGIRVKLLNFNSTNAASGRGTGFADLTFKITGMQTNEVVYNNINLSDLLICTDATYEALLLYNTSTGAFTQTYQTHGF
jgi:hypothetical protein